jgi:hypothetical protein
LLSFLLPAYVMGNSCHGTSDHVLAHISHSGGQCRRLPVPRACRLLCLARSMLFALALPAKLAFQSGDAAKEGGAP